MDPIIWEHGMVTIGPRRPFYRVVNEKNDERDTRAALFHDSLLQVGQRNHRAPM